MTLINNKTSKKIITKETNDNISKLDNISYFTQKFNYLLLDKFNLVLNDNESLLMVVERVHYSELWKIVCFLIPQKPFISSVLLQSNGLRNQLLFPKYMNDKIAINDIDIKCVKKNKFSTSTYIFIRT
eukprot:158973_1